MAVRRTRQQKEKIQKQLQEAVVFQYQESSLATNNFLLHKSKKIASVPNSEDFTLILRDLKQSVVVSLLIVVILFALYYFELVG